MTPSSKQPFMGKGDDITPTTGFEHMVRPILGSISTTRYELIVTIVSWQDMARQNIDSALSQIAISVESLAGDVQQSSQALADHMLGNNSLENNAKQDGLKTTPTGWDGSDPIELP